MCAGVKNKAYQKHCVEQNRSGGEIKNYNGKIIIGVLPECYRHGILYYHFVMLHQFF